MAACHLLAGNSYFDITRRQNPRRIMSKVELREPVGRPPAPLLQARELPCHPGPQITIATQTGMVMQEAAVVVARHAATNSGSVPNRSLMT